MSVLDGYSSTCQQLAAALVDPVCPEAKLRASILANPTSRVI